VRRARLDDDRLLEQEALGTMGERGGIGGQAVVRPPPAPTVTTPASTAMERIGVTLITIPAVEERPAKQCPPLRIAVGRPRRRASASVSATSAGDAHSTTAAGRMSWKRAIAGRRTAS
jgi:hypothetical protein